MSLVRILFVLTAVSVVSTADALDFPAAPETAAAAEAAGMDRLRINALRTAFTGARDERNTRGEIYSAEYRPDGSIELSNGGNVIDRGTFSVTGQHGGSVCVLLEKQMNQRLCAVWFAAPDAVHLFGYNPTDGKLRAVSRAAAR